MLINFMLINKKECSFMEFEPESATLIEFMGFNFREVGFFKTKTLIKEAKKPVFMFYLSYLQLPLRELFFCGN